MKYLFLFFISCLIAPINSHAASASAKQKYPYTLITNDYGILNDNDLASFTWRDGTAKPFSAEAAKGAFNIWQCFPREFVMVTLSDTGHSSDELGWKNNVAYLEIYILKDDDINRVNSYTKHAYAMRANLSIADYQKRFNKWLKLMKGEKYVCLAGHFVNREKEEKNGKTWITYDWIFEKLKTKKGVSY